MSDDNTTDTTDSANTPPDWRALIDTELNASPELQNFQSINDMAKSYVELKSLQGESLRIPSKDAGEEAYKKFRQNLNDRVPDLIQLPPDEDSEGWDEVYKRLGAKDEYDLPDEYSHLAELLPIAKAAKLTDKQFKNMLAKADESNRLAREEADVRKATFAQELKAEWGLAADSKVAKIMKMTELNGAPQELHKALGEGTVPPAMLFFLDKVADQLSGEGGALSDDRTPQANMKLTPSQITGEISDILGNSEYWDESSPRNAYLKKRMLELHTLQAANR